MSALVCGVCEISGSLVCSGCKEVAYCSKEHQVIAWRNGHKAQCKTRSANLYSDDSVIGTANFEIRSCEKGLGAFALRLIRKGELIIAEKPLLVVSSAYSSLEVGMARAQEAYNKLPVANKK